MVLISYERFIVRRDQQKYRDVRIKREVQKWDKREDEKEDLIRHG